MLEKCPQCGVARIGGSFRWSHQGKVATPQEVAAKVCRYVDRSECINACQDWRDSDGWQLPPSWEDLDQMVAYLGRET